MTTAFDQRRIWIAWFAVFFAVTGVMRALTGHALEIDQAEMLRYAQTLEWGYGPQPPLYAWLQWAVFQMTGPEVGGLFLLKSFLLWLTPTIMLILLSQAMPVREAGLAALSLVLIYSISFDSQRTLTHAVLALDLTLAFAVVLWVILRASAHPSDWLGLGVLLGLGFLAKPSFALVPAALVLSVLTLPELRRGLTWQGIGLAAATAGLVCLGPAIWALTNADVALDSVRKFDIAEQVGFLQTVPVSLREFLWSSFLFAGVALIVIGIFAAIARLRGPVQVTARTGDERLMLVWLWRYTLIAWGIFALFTIGAQVTHFKERWLQTSLVFLAPLLTLWVLPRMSDRLRHAFTVTLLVFVTLVGGVVSFQDVVRASRRAAPFDVLAPQVQSVLPADGVILGENWIAGNLLKALPGVPVHPEYAPLDPERAYLFVWNTMMSPMDGPEQLRAQIGEGWGLEPVGVIEAPYHVNPERVLVLNLARVVPEG